MEINVKFVPHWVAKLAAYHRIPVSEVESVMTVSDIGSYKNAQGIVQYLMFFLGIGQPFEEVGVEHRSKLYLDVFGPSKGRIKTSDLNLVSSVKDLIVQGTLTTTTEDGTIYLIHDVDNTPSNQGPVTGTSHPAVIDFMKKLITLMSSRMSESELFSSKIFNRYLKAELESTVPV